MKALTKHLPWIQLIFVIGGMIFLYGQQMQTVKDVERRTAQCEENIRNINYESKEISNILSEIKADIREIKTDIKYIKVGK